MIIIILFFLIMMLTGCATAPKVNGGDDMALADPYEKINRLSYNFTDSIDRIFLEPAVNVYTEYVPGAAQRSVGNFYDNLSYPSVVLNAFLQGKIRQGFEDGLRFIVNSTIGLFGLFDMATHMGLAENDEDFGQTLGVWGVDAGSYLFIPMLGPNNERDISDIPISIATNVLFYAGYMVGATVLAPLTVLGAIDKRARLSGPMRIRDQAALDPYLFVREASMQQREYLIYDGSPPLEIYNELFQDNLLQSNFIDEVSD
ncbi:MlaA family lipoprotein [Nitrosomonas cryotolerans]|uniref:MlaA family lipoprotein n=1 Tax=Nitrosomonas cryotolerans TaxID=44575 RepID=UPI00210EE0F0|nr:VacJ family lipoprotein [Nitrosomonas cryotolerans]